MKTVRICLLLLAVLLPLRGAVAAAMLCSPAGVGTQSELRTGHHAPGHHAPDSHATGHHAMGHHGDMAGSPAADDAARHGDGPSSDGDEGASGAHDKCTLCAAFCSLTPLVDSSLGVIMPHALAAASFPALVAPVPSFLSGGQERPPRSI